MGNVTLPFHVRKGETVEMTTQILDEDKVERMVSNNGLVVAITTAAVTIKERFRKDEHLTSIETGLIHVYLKRKRLVRHAIVEHDQNHELCVFGNSFDVISVLVNLFNNTYLMMNKSKKCRGIKYNRAKRANDYNLTCCVISYLPRVSNGLFYRS